MTSVFISYRRSDAAPYAGRLYDRLSARFGDAAVFMDIDDIELGADFPQVIADTLARADVVLVVMGSNWAQARAPDGRRRLDDAADFVRLEVETAIRLGKRIVPLLVGGAVMPAAAALPPELAALTRYNALAIDDARFDADLGRLLEVLDPVARRTPSRSGTGSPAQARRRGPILAGIALGGALLLAAGGYWLTSTRYGTSPAADGTPAPAQAALDGNWTARVTYGWGATHQESFVFSTRGGEVLGAAGFLGVARPIVGGSLRGAEIAFSTRTQEMLGRDTRDLVHQYRGTVVGDAIRFLLVTEGGSGGKPVEFTATRAP